MTIREEAFQGLPISCPIIDAHNHTGITNSNGWHQNLNSVETGAFMKDLDRLGIDCIISSTHMIGPGYMQEANLQTVAEAAQFPGRVYGYIAVVPWCGMDAVREELKKYARHPAFVGLKLLAGYHGEILQPEYEYALDFADEVGCPVLCHIWNNIPDRSGIPAALRNRHNMKFMVAHQGGGREKDTYACVPIIRDHENAYMELCGSLFNRIPVEGLAELVGVDKLIFGTDAIDLDAKFELGKVAFSPLDDAAKKKIFAENFLRISKDSQMSHIVLKK